MNNSGRHPMPCQDPLVRNRNFKEVALGYDAETAIEEAKRCLNCKHHPCVSGCPVNISIPEFISFVAEGKFEEAYKVIAKPLLCLLCAAEFARRKGSANQNVFAV